MTNDYAKNLRQKVSEYRNLSALARRAGVTRKTLYDFIRGSTPTLQNLDAIEKALQETTEEGDARMGITETDLASLDTLSLNDFEKKLVLTHRSADPYKYIREAIMDLHIANNNLTEMDSSTKKLVSVALRILEDCEK